MTLSLSAAIGTSVSQRLVSRGVRCRGYWSRPMTTYALMESLMRLCLRLDHSTPNGYCPLSLRGRRLGVRLVMAVVPQPASSRGSRSRGRNLFIVTIMRQSVTQGSGGCKVGFGRFARRSAHLGFFGSAEFIPPDP